MLGNDPIRELERWIEEARAEGIPQPASVAFVTVGEGGRPSARTVTMKRIEDDALLFTSALWTRKAQEIEANPQVALLFHWPALGRQVHVTGEASLAERALAEELFAQRDPFHQLQTVVSRQGEEIDDLDQLRDRLAHLARSRRRRRCVPRTGAPCGYARRRSSSGAKPTTASTSGGCSRVGATAGAGPSWHLRAARDAALKSG